VHALNHLVVLPLLPKVIIRLVEMSSSSNLGPGELGKRRDVKTVDNGAGKAQSNKGKTGQSEQLPVWSLGKISLEPIINVDAEAVHLEPFHFVYKM
jgi:hypothetical protein